MESSLQVPRPRAGPYLFLAVMQPGPRTIIFPESIKHTRHETPDTAGGGDAISVCGDVGSLTVRTVLRTELSQRVAVRPGLPDHQFSLECLETGADS